MDEELRLIMEHVEAGHHFLLSGGAGSGKTYTLVQVIRQLIEKYPSSLIACITYTNAAVREIDNRVNHDNLRVSTIHDFLWDCIGNFQNELRKSLLDMINSGELNVGTHVEIPVSMDLFIQEGSPIEIKYKEYVRVREGVISHDEVMKVATYMFEHYKKLRDIVKGSYPFILIDEYQDTNPMVVSTLLRTFELDDDRKCCVGFFGDSMQAIYDDGVGDLQGYLQPDGMVYEVKKEQNRRSPQVVIELANKIRLDDLRQRESGDANAPNMVDGQLKTGKALFLYSLGEEDRLDDTIAYLSEHEHWTFDNPRKTKELNLTHNLIAGKAGFGTLMDIHRGDGILKYRDRVKGYVDSKDIVTEGKTFGEVLDELSVNYPKESRKYSPTTYMRPFIDSHQELMEKAKTYLYDEFIKMYVSADQLVDDKKQDEDEASKTGSKRSELIRHLMKIERCIYLYQTNHVADFLRVTEWKINTIDDKKRLKEAIAQLVDVGDKTIGDIIELAHRLGIVHKDDALDRYAERCSYIYDRLMVVPYQEVQNLYKYLEGMTPFSTQHKTKGTEFDNVFVILDNGKWNNYNFDRLFTAEGDELQDTVVKRSRKIFYVCCTRTKENLAVYYHKPSAGVLAKAREWFGNDNVIEI